MEVLYLEVISGVISPLIGVISIVTLLIAPLISTHEPPSRVWGLAKTVIAPCIFNDLFLVLPPLCNS